MQVKVHDIYGDGRHVAIDVVSSEFEGKSAVARQRMVYKVGPRLRGKVRERVCAGYASGVRPPLAACAAVCESVAGYSGSGQLGGSIWLLAPRDHASG